MSFNQNEALYLIQGLQFPNSKLRDVLEKIINGLADIEKSITEVSTRGLWTPLDNSGAGLAFTYTFPSEFIKVGDIIFVSGDITWPVTANAAAVSIKGLPYLSGAGQYDFAIGYTTFNGPLFGIVITNSFTFTLFNPAGGAQITNVQMSAQSLRFTTFYLIAKS